MIVTTYSESELRTLAFDLGVNYDALPGEGTKARELVFCLGRRQDLQGLLGALQRERPKAFDEASLSLAPKALYNDVVGKRERVLGYFEGLSEKVADIRSVAGLLESFTSLYLIKVWGRPDLLDYLRNTKRIKNRC